MKPLIDIIDTTNEPNILQTNQRGAVSYTALKQYDNTTSKKAISLHYKRPFILGVGIHRGEP